jgi:hypothetical protein
MRLFLADFVVKVAGGLGPDRMSVFLVLLRVRTRHSQLQYHRRQPRT